MNTYILKYSSLLFLFIVFGSVCFGQQKDSITPAQKRHNIFHYAIKAFRKNSPDTANQQGKLNTKPEEGFMQYNGKIIRQIKINQFGFEKTFTDTTKKINYFGTKLLNGLHHNSRSWLIRNNLYIKPNSVFNSYRVADNERYLRTLDYIQDARMVVTPVEGDTSSVDVEVITKDLFSLTGQLHSASSKKFKATVLDANILGTGQQVSVTSLVQGNRAAAYGADVAYSINNIAGLFLNGTAEYSAINADISRHQLDEHAVYFALDRPLVSQYKHFAGGLSFGNYYTANNFGFPDSLYYAYAHTAVDVWGGYNFGIKRYLLNPKLKLRKFLAVRVLADNFRQQPYQTYSKLNFRYDDKTAVLGQLTLFKQEFYKTNYIFGFGNTEDIPYGFNISFTGGWYKQMSLSRPYTGIDANKYYFTKAGNIFQYFLRAGTFYGDKKMQDAIVLGGLTMYSHLMEFDNFKMRQFMRLSYTRQFNRVGLDPLSINNPFGLRYFRGDSTRGYQRLSLHSETAFFINMKVFGFKFSPFSYGDVSMLSPENKSITKSGFYYGIGGGVRTRNENLVFGTTEFRFVYFPRKTTDMSHQFMATLKTNIRFRYNSSYVSKPDLIEYNSDSQNDIY